MKTAMILKAIDRIIKDKQHLFSHSRIKQYSRLRDLVNKCSETPQPTQEYANTLFQYMNEMGLANSSAVAYIKALLSALNYSTIPHSISMRDVLRGVRETAKSDKIFLSREELRRLYEFKPSSESLLKVRDLFIFCANTGLRHNEAMRITKDDIQNQGKFKILRYTTSKNNTVNEVPLNDTCLEIMDRWDLLPKLGNSKANLYLHLLLKEIGYNDTVVSVHYIGSERVEQVLPKWQLVTFHTSRRSFCCNMLENGLNIKEISDIVGISISTLENYYAYTNTERRNLKAFKILNQ